MFTLFGLIWMAIFGIVVGSVAKFLSPGEEDGLKGYLPTSILGILGSIVGGTISNLIGGSTSYKIFGIFPSAGLVLSVVGAMILCYLWNKRQSIMDFVKGILSEM